MTERLRDGLRFVAVCRSQDLVRGRGMRIELDEWTDIAIFRSADSCLAVSNVCPHQHHAIICDGIREGETIVCPMHGWQFDLASGKELSDRGSLRTYQVFEEDGLVFLEYRPEPRPAWMDSAV